MKSGLELRSLLYQRGKLFGVGNCSRVSDVVKQSLNQRLLPLFMRGRSTPGKEKAPVQNSVVASC